MVPHKKTEQQWLYLGVPGTGKSWKARQDTWKGAQLSGGLIFAHDPNHSFDDDGVTIPSIRYPDAQAFGKGVMERGGQCVHILDTENGDDVLLLARRAAAASVARGKANAEQTGGVVMMTPVIIYWDETANAGEKMTKRQLSPTLVNLMANRRHDGLIPVLTTQSTFFAHRTLLTLCTRIVIFRTPDPEDGERLRSVGLPRELALRLNALPKRQYVELTRGRVTHVPDWDAEEPESEDPMDVDFNGEFQDPEPLPDDAPEVNESLDPTSSTGAA